jgi:NADPH:quinone reductase-like Zn-dependent oxidoreductase
MKYRSVVVTKRGGRDALQIMENELRPPAAGEVRIKIQATPVCQDDVAVRVGNRPFLPKLPFVPGYSILGEVDALGEGVSQVAVGERVAALTQCGGYAEYIYLAPETLVQAPAALDPAEAATLILNYLVAYQILHRVAQVEPGDKVLLIGASGGVGTAFLQLGKLAGLKMYGLASAGKHKLLAAYGATPIDYHRQDFVEVLRQAEPGGLDFVFNGMGEEQFERGLAVLRRGGALVHYGGPQSLGRFLLLLVKFVFYNLMPNGKAIKGYGTHRVGVELLKQDWTALFKLLEERQIRPIIAAKFPILEAAAANECLEGGQVIGNVVLLSPELLSGK